MSMVIAHNMAALSALNTLSGNTKSLTKALKQTSSGQRINSAGDDSSGYAISEKMRVQIRGLDQANRNAQNGASALRVVEGGLQQMTELVKTLKERAINAANDTNTDEDRAIIQKEVDQYIDQIDDIASTTSFNGMKLLDGSFALKSTMDHTDEGLVLRGLNTWWIEQSVDLISECYGIGFDTAAGTREIEVILKDEGANGRLAYVGSSTSGIYAEKLTLTVNMNYFKNMTPEMTNGGNDPANYLDRTIAHELTHAVQRTNFGGIRNTAMPKWFTEGIAELTHGGDERVRASGAVSGQIASGKASDGTAQMYGGGFMALRYLTEQCGTDTVKKINQYLLNKRPLDTSGATFDDAIKFATNGRYPNADDVFDKMNADLTTAGSDAAFLKNYCGIDLFNNDRGSAYGSDFYSRYAMGFNAEKIIDEGGGTYGRLPTGTSTIRGLTVKWPSIGAGMYGAMVIQTDTKANRGVNFAIDKMDAGQLGLRNLNLGTQFDAEHSISQIDRAVNKVTDLATLIGSYLSRLEASEANITTSHENTTNAESVIRDADMAMAMTDYTKHNVLAQAAQSMLAQANQNSSNVLSLLQ